VQGVARQFENGAVGVGELSVSSARERRVVGAVELVADHGGAEQREVQANLVLASGQKAAANERVDAARRARSSLDDINVGRGIPCVRPVARTHLDAERTREIEFETSSESKASGPVSAVGNAPGHGHIDLFDAVTVLELLFQSTVANAGLAHDEKAARLAIKPVPEGQECAFGARCLKLLDERIAVVTGGRMHGKHRRLVDRHEVVVLVDDRHVAGGCRFVPGGPPQENPLLGLDPRVRGELAPTGVERAGPDDGLRPGSARPVKFGAQEHIEPLAGNLGRHTKHRYDGAFGDARRPLERGLDRA